MNLHKGEQHFVKYIVFYLSFAPQGIILEIMCQISYALMYICIQFKMGIDRERGVYILVVRRFDRCDVINDTIMYILKCK